MIVGAALQSWLAFVLMFLGLSWLLDRRKDMILIFALSLAWGFIPFCMGAAWGGWVWAAILGGLVFIKGLQVHLRELKRPWGNVGLAEHFPAVGWRQNWYLGGQNLN